MTQEQRGTMIKIRRPLSSDGVGIDVAPLVDVLFTLLIFFSLTSSFLHESGIKIKLPEAAAGAPIEHIRRIEIAIPAEGDLRINDVAIGSEGIAELLGKIDIAERPTYLIVVKGDAAASHGRITTVLDAVKNMGFRTIAIATRSRK